MKYQQSNFENDLVESFITVDEIMDIFKSYGYQTTQSTIEEEPYYDFIATKNDRILHIEVKENKYTEQTKNCVVEYECNNKPSGIRWKY